MTVAKNQMTEAAMDLALCLPAAEAEATQSRAMGGVFGSIYALYEALKAGDWEAAVVAVREILNAIIGDDGTTIQFQEQAAVAGFDWRGILAILKRILPLILDSIPA